MEQECFCEQVFEIAFGDKAIDRGFSMEEVLAKLREFSDKSLAVDQPEDWKEIKSKYV